MMGIWYSGIDERVVGYLESIRKQGYGRYLPCREGATEVGQQIELGWSCFALKIFWMLGEWRNISYEHQRGWVEHIQSYQRSFDTDNPDGIQARAYVDDAIASYWGSLLHTQKLTYRRVSDFVKTSVKITLGRQIKEKHSEGDRAIIADTKQALATLAEVGESSRSPYGYFPDTVEQLKNYVFSFDWRYPWNAGGQTAALAVFLSLEAPRLLDEESLHMLSRALCASYRELAVAETGGYYTGKAPDHGMLINGAMKVLTALDWLSEPIHYSRQLIDTALSKTARPDGCHLVDTVYVLYRCAGETEYRRRDIKEYLSDMSELIRRHHSNIP